MRLWKLICSDHGSHVVYTNFVALYLALCCLQFFTTNIAGRSTDICGLCGLDEYELEQPPAEMLSLYALVQPTCSKCRAEGKGFLQGRRVGLAAARAAKAGKKAAREEKKRAAGSRVPSRRRGAGRGAKRARLPSSEEEVESSGGEEAGSSGAELALSSSDEELALSSSDEDLVLSSDSEEPKSSTH